MRSAESAPSPACAGPAPGYRLRRLRVALGTWVAIEASAQSEASAAEAIEAAYAALTEVERRMHPEREGDRKSTRLNSSHSQISYAVFCLKKKIYNYTAAEAVVRTDRFCARCAVDRSSAVAVARPVEAWRQFHRGLVVGCGCAGTRRDPAG